MFDIKKILVRLMVITLMIGIFAYIFWPSKNQDNQAIDSLPEDIDTTTTMQSSTTIEQVTTSTTLLVSDPPCLVLYQKDKDIMSLSETPCIDTYVKKYINNYYSQLIIVCRSSGDGNAVNRDDLSLKRMKSLQFTLMQKGVSFDDIQAQSLSDKSPYPGVDPLTDDGKIINRSCEITGVSNN